MKKSTMLGLAIAACAAMAIPSATSARLADVVETTQASQTMHSTVTDPTVGTSAGCIDEPIGVLTMAIHIPMGDTLLTLTADILPTSMAGTIVRPISGDGTNAVVGLALIVSRPHAEPAVDVERRGRFDRVT